MEVSTDARNIVFNSVVTDEESITSDAIMILCKINTVYKELCDDNTFEGRRETEEKEVIIIILVIIILFGIFIIPASLLGQLSFWCSHYILIVVLALIAICLIEDKYHANLKKTSFSDTYGLMYSSGLRSTNKNRLRNLIENPKAQIRQDLFNNSINFITGRPMLNFPHSLISKQNLILAYRKLWVHNNFANLSKMEKVHAVLLKAFKDNL